jgi:hypothetical protein
MLTSYGFLAMLAGLNASQILAGTHPTYRYRTHRLALAGCPPG